MNKLTKAAILSISLLVIITGSAVSPALVEISETFSDANSKTIKMILSLPSGVIIPFSLLSGKIASMTKKRKIIIVGLIIYIIGGIGGGFSRSIFELLFFRGVLGIGMGLLTPLTTSLVADFFEENERIKMMGFSNAVSNLGGIIATLVSGGLAIINWRYVFGVYSIAIIVFILVIFGLPEPKKRIVMEKRNIINKKIFIISLQGLFLNIAFYAVVTNIALFIKNENIGNSVFSGLAMSFLTLGGFISGIFLGKLSEFLKRSNAPIGICIMSIGFFIISSAYDITTILFSTFMIGIGLGILKPILLLRVTHIIPKYSNSFALSIVSSSMLLGKFISPFFLDFLGNIFKNNNTTMKVQKHFNNFPLQ
ncbi:MFS transporter [Tepidibacter formicigenes]|jgi:MFS family permease|uniref:Major Facilitator Superfamily protein n=1 Tax=Tepidibacter formicigenes DSM 15518 TaxID=1123349 RepID=A0A1M6TVY9_9FIRM|nr:MFS transporter [Tepidibacter formicigenes]SHK60978.1 Major Facilitator Superfamily protein [Tepidibacter formicigenes DSM 15518]